VFKKGRDRLGSKDLIGSRKKGKNRAGMMIRPRPCGTLRKENSGAIQWKRENSVDSEYEGMSKKNATGEKR